MTRFFRPSSSIPGALPGLSSPAVDPAPAVPLSDRVTHPSPLHPPGVDGLTGLSNRTGLETVLQHRLTADEADRTAVLSLDLDFFTRVNDSLGHRAGNALLVQVAQRLRDATRPDDVVARIGGDEFAVCLSGLEAAEHAHTIAARIYDRLEQPMALGNQTVYTPASIGVVADLTPYDSVEVVLRNANTALNEAKDVPHRPYVVYEAAMTRRARAQLSLDTALRQALDRSEFVPFFQPILALDDGSLHGVEVLARWRHPDDGLLTPDTFLDIAEDTGLIVPIGHQVIRKACDAVCALRRRQPGAPPLSLTANFSRQEFFRAETYAFLTDLFDTYDLPPTDFTMEISERTVAGIAAEDVTAFQNLKALGVGILLDDFGTGFSSLQSLRRLPVDGLKIDKGLLADTNGQSWNEDLIDLIVQMGHTLGHTVTAEGVERTDQLHALRGMDCSYGQGYLFARPAPASALGSLLAAPFRSRFWRTGRGDS